MSEAIRVPSVRALTRAGFNDRDFHAVDLGVTCEFGAAG